MLGAVRPPFATPDLSSFVLQAQASKAKIIGIAGGPPNNVNEIKTGGEFGVFKDYSDPKMRAAWIDDTRTALESRQIGWAMWDYDGNFGLASKSSAGIVFDPAILQALGMGR